MEAQENVDLEAGSETKDEQTESTKAKEPAPQEVEIIGANIVAESTGFRVKNVCEINSAIDETDANDEKPTTSNGEVQKRKLPDWMMEQTTKRSATQPDKDTTKAEDGENGESSEKKSKLENVAETETPNDPPTIKTEPATNSASGDELAGSREEQDIDNTASTSGACTSTGSTTSKTEIKVEKADASSTSRESCRFGIRCFRRNPLHRTEEAHPGDPDYKRPNYPPPPEGTPDCPYGKCCYRRNPTHFQMYSHPSDTDFEQNYTNYRLRLRQRSYAYDQQHNISSSSQTTGDSDLDDEEPFLDDDESEYVPSDDGFDEMADYDDCDRAEE